MISTNSNRPLYDTVPRLYTEARSQLLTPEMAAQIADALDQGRWLIFHGPAGRGKTFAMATVANSESGNGWIDFSEFLGDVRAHWKMRTPDADRFDPMRWVCHYSGRLFVDDVGAENDELGVERFPIIVNTRYNAMKRCCFTTNLNPAELEARYGTRTISRLTEVATWIHMTGADRRVLRAVS